MSHFNLKLQGWIYLPHRHLVSFRFKSAEWHCFLEFQSIDLQCTDNEIRELWLLGVCKFSTRGITTRERDYYDRTLVEKENSMVASYNSIADERICLVVARGERDDGENAIKDFSLCCLTNFVKSRATPRRSRVSELTKLPRRDIRSPCKISRGDSRDAIPREGSLFFANT